MALWATGRRPDPSFTTMVFEPCGRVLGPELCRTKASCRRKVRKKQKKKKKKKEERKKNDRKEEARSKKQEAKERRSGSKLQELQ